MIAFIDTAGRLKPVVVVSKRVAGLVRSLRRRAPRVGISDKTVPIASDDLGTSSPAPEQENTRNVFWTHVHGLAGRLGDKNRRWLITGVLLILVSESVLTIGWAPQILTTNNRDSKVEQYLVKAKTAMGWDKLTSPAQDNAYFYYQEVLKLVPDHEGAKQGLRDIANRYAELTEQAVEQFEYVNAGYYLRKGLGVQPDNQRLIALKERTNAVKDVPNRLINKLQSVFQ